MIKIDRRVEILMAIIIAYKNMEGIKKKDLEELDFVEYPDIPYAKELTSKINITKYKEIIPYIESDFDCSYYANLYLYFDKDMNFTDEYQEVFPGLKNNGFASIVKKIYDNEKIEEVFNKYKDTFKEMLSVFKNVNNLDLTKDCSKFYNSTNTIYDIVASSLFNGGFSSNKGNYVSFLKSIGYKDNNFFVTEYYFIVCLFHEYSHHFVNPLVDKYINYFNITNLRNESFNNGLPKPYQGEIQTYLYELIVRSNAEYLSLKYINKEDYNDDMEYNKEIGFLYVEDIMNLIKERKNNYNTYEEFFVNELIPFINNLNLKRSKLL